MTELVPGARMVWSDGMAPMFKGERTFTLTARGDGTTDFEMVEVFSGVMLPMIKGSPPDFGLLFDRYALDLKREAERSAAEAGRRPVQGPRGSRRRARGQGPRGLRGARPRAARGLSYQALKLGDGVSFVHVATISTADGTNPLTELPGLPCLHGRDRRPPRGAADELPATVGAYEDARPTA
ncbi:MAG: hypothetical protein U0235_16025 [Polyangiaceae bacterium]